MSERGDRLSWAEIRRLALRHKKALLFANLVAVLATLCTVPIPLLLPLLVDEVLLGKGDGALRFMDRLLPADWQVAFGYIGLMLAATLLLRGAALVFNVLQAKLFARLSKDIVYRIRLRLIERLRHIALGEYETLGGGSISAHLVTDLDTLDKFVGETLSRFLVALLTLLGTAAILVWMHWQLALLILLFNPLVIWSTVQLGKRVKHLKKLENDSTARFTQALTETLEAIQEVRAGNRQGYFLGRLGHRAQEVRDYAVASQWKSDAAGRASGLLFQFGIDVFRAAAMLTVLLSDLSIGQMLAVFSYLVALVGASGGGKSTLVQLLLGLYSAQRGSIRYGGVPLEENGLDCVREHVAVVLQHPALFNDSVRANLTMGRERSDQACWRALQIAQLADGVRRLPQGLDTVVGRSGVRLSGGQRQRLAIARMILAEPKVVILDEATSALDAATEYALHQALGDFLEGRTTLIVAHRLSAVKQADRVLVFDGGHIAEDGDHQQLIAEGGLYARLYGHLQQM